MALSGSTAKAYSSKSAYWVWTEWTATQNIANNTSTVTAITYGGTNGYGYYTGSDNDSYINVYYNGTNHTTAVGDSGDWAYNTSKRELCRRTEVVPHNADGTMAIAVVGHWRFGSTFNLTSSANFTLDTIPRASSISSIVGGELAKPVTVNISRAADSFTHTVIYRRTDGVDVTVGNGVGTSCEFTPALSDASLIPSAGSGTATIFVHTYSGGTYVGTSSLSFTVTVPGSVVHGVSNAVTGNNLLGGNYVQGKSTVSVTVSEASSYGSWVTYRNTTITGASSNGATSFASTALTTSGTVTISTSITDSRGRSNSSSRTINVVAYNIPTVTAFGGFRCNSDGTANSSGEYMKITGSSSISPVNNANGKLTKLQYRVTGSSTWLDATSNSSSYTPSLSAVVAADTNTSYEIQIYAADTYSSSVYVGTIPTSFVLMDFAADGKSMAIGKVAAGNGVLEVGGDLVVSGNVKSNGKTLAAQTTVYSFDQGVLVDLIPASQLYTMLYLEVRGNGYGAIPINTTIQAYHYTPSGTLISCAQVNNGSQLSAAKFFLDGGRVKCWFAQSSSYQTINVKAYVQWGPLNDITVTNAPEPAGTNKVTCSLTNFLPSTGGTVSGVITANSMYTGNWFRSTGDSGWFSETYGGGIYMTDTSYVRTYNNKAFLTDGGIVIGNGRDLNLFASGASSTDPGDIVFMSSGGTELARLYVANGVLWQRNQSGALPGAVRNTNNTSMDHGLVALNNSSWTGVSFYQGFSGTPRVVLTGETTVSGQINMPKVRNVTASGFEAIISGTGQSCNYGWLAYYSKY